MVNPQDAPATQGVTLSGREPGEVYMPQTYLPSIRSQPPSGHLEQRRAYPGLLLDDPHYLTSHDAQRDIPQDLNPSITPSLALADINHRE